MGLSTVKELIPGLQQMPLMPLDQPTNSVNLLPTEGVTPLMPYGIEPKLRLAIVALDMGQSRSHCASAWGGPPLCLGWNRALAIKHVAGILPHGKADVFKRDGIASSSLDTSSARRMIRGSHRSNDNRDSVP
jgi:hypothetical protein